MLDRADIPNSLGDTQGEVNPYEITDKIWNLIEEYFIDKYNIEYKEAFPQKEVTKSTIICYVQKRTPGRENSKIHGKGSNFTKFLKRSPDGYVHEIHTQQQELTLEYIVYANSTAEVKRIAWDLERAILETVGVLQGQIEGFQLWFDQQTPDSSMLWGRQDELIKRTLRFKALLPIKFTKLVPELRYIELIETWGAKSVSGSVFIRSSSSKTFNIEVNAGQKVVSIRNVYMKKATYPYEWEALTSNTDFTLKRNADQSVFLEWNDDYGKTPTVGEQFRLDYDLSHIIKGSTIKPK